MSDTFNYGIDQMTVAIALGVASGRFKGILNKEAISRINASHEHVKKIVSSNTTVYGVNTGFGILANTKISETDTATLQHKLLQSHSVGVGDPIPIETA